MNEFSPNYKELLITFVGEKQSINKLFGSHEKYKVLINTLCKYDINDDETLPSQKEMINDLGLNRSQLIGLMRSLYRDFLTEVSHFYPIKKTEVHISGENRSGNFFQLSLDGIEQIPSIGETIRLPFIRHETGGGGHYQVKRITHKIEESIHSIVLFVDEDFDVRTLGMKQYIT
tara:strand:+ start:28913 stop:29434 length:522 start_codon:yes stop_codon:yes gene_type:complete